MNALQSLAPCTTLLAGALVFGIPQPVEHDWTSVLVTLQPSYPRAYLLLAEDILSRGDGGEDDRLAAQLFALSGALDPAGLGRSAALAVAAAEDPSSPEGARRRGAAEALARVRAGQTAFVRDRPPAGAVLAAADAAAHIRAGRMSDARALLTDTEAAAAFELLAAGAKGGAARLRMDMDGGRDGARPPVDAADVEFTLLSTAAALGSDDTRWSLAIVRTKRVPLVWVDEEGLAQMLGVTRERPVWRDGQWVAAPSTPAR